MCNNELFLLTFLTQMKIARIMFLRFQQCIPNIFHHLDVVAVILPDIFIVLLFFQAFEEALDKDKMLSVAHFMLGCANLRMNR